jgi:hypothetical protein
MEQDQETETKEIIGDLLCPKGFMCCIEGLENISQATDIELEEYMKCLEEGAALCQFSVSFDSYYFCSCPVRINIWRNLGIESWGSYVKH